MGNRFSAWLKRLPVADPLERRQAAVFQLVLIGWIILASIFVLIDIPLLFGPPPPGAPPLPPEMQSRFLVFLGLLTTATLLLWLCPVSALVVLRRGHFKRSAAIATLGLLLAHTIATYTLGVAVATAYIVFQIPIAMAGLLVGRRLLLTASGVSIAAILVISNLQSQSPPLAGLAFFIPLVLGPDGTLVAPPPFQFPGLDVIMFVGITILLTLLLDRFGSALRQALSGSLEREAELTSIRASLETTVAERTAAMQRALDETQARAAEQARLVEEQARLLTEIDQQRNTIRELSVPVIPISADTLVMPLVGALDSARLQQLQEQGLQALEQTSAHTLVLDITGVPIVDSQVAQGFLMTVRSARLLGADVFLVGIRPEVAQALVGLGVQLGDVRTFSDLQSALAYIPAGTVSRFKHEKSIHDTGIKRGKA
jgi:rsbT co-antagonist protein RsbR